jgi:hypothetical protein
MAGRRLPERCTSRPAKRRGDDQPGGRSEQREAQHAVGQVQVLLVRRDPGQPDTVGDTQHREVRHHGRPGTLQPPCSDRTLRQAGSLLGAAAGAGAGGVPGKPGFDASTIPGRPTTLPS